MTRLVSNAAGRLAPVLVALIMALFAAGPALAEDYTLDTGDALRIAVFGEPAYPIDVSVDDRGTVSLPLLGDVEARGMTTKDLAQRIRQSFQDQKLLIDPFIQVDVKEYRPFFISGAVANPGSYPYKPGITIRHALAIAGGFKALTIDNQAPALRIADLRAERANLLVEEFRYRAKLLRLQAESLDEKTFAVPADRPTDIAPQLLNDIVGSEVQQLEARRAGHAQDLSHLQASLARASKDAELLGQAMRERESAANYQMQQLESARKLQKQGLVTNSNLLTAERAQNSYRVDLAEASVDQARARQEILDLESKISGIKTARRLELISQIEQAQLELAKTQSALRYTSDKLMFVSAYGQHRTFDDLRGSVRIVIYRGRDGDAQTIEANESTPVRAGDVIEVSILANQQFYDPNPPSVGN